MANKVAKRVVNKVAKRVVKRANKGYNKCCKDIIISGRRQMMNIGVETEKIEYKKQLEN